jgi:hypothetical protein
MYNTFSGLIFSLTFSNINKTINSIAFPNGLFTVNFTTPDPEVRITFGMDNALLAPVDNVKVNFSIDIVYYNLIEGSSAEMKVFQRQEKLGAIKPLERINRTIISTIHDFNLEFLDDYWNSIENLTGLIFYVDVEVSCGIMGSLFPFYLKIDDLDLISLGCTTCEVI